MNKIYHLSNCSTCQRIIAQLKSEDLVLQDIKTDPITESQLDALKQKSGSYEALFSRRAMKYRALGLHEQILSESDYKRLILEEYTFLKRPVIEVDDRVFVGSSKNIVADAITALEG